MSVRVIVDHVAGSRRGQRQEFPAGERVRFGRHPDCEVSFDPHRDIDASSRHAELRPRLVDGAGWVLVDVGSSNGTYIDGHRVTEASITPDVPVSVQFGPGGPRIRLFVGDDAAIGALPPLPIERARPRWLAPAIAGVVVLLLVVLLLRC
ncbi:MAG TPA: FHA domain-containing protein [Kofleriaceae bacterium]|nr:FHA domain-containing protein [Kofleriaceae bacterium]